MEGIDDQWDNAITEKAIVLRGVEDTAEKGQIETRLAELAVLTTLTDEQRWEKQYKEKRLAAINEREAQGNVGRLIKRGSGTLTLTAVNSYSGGTEIHGGTVAGLTESFGTGPVTVKSGAAVELHAAFDVRHADDTDWVTTHVTGTATVFLRFSALKPAFCASSSQVLPTNTFFCLTRSVSLMPYLLRLLASIWLAALVPISQPTEDMSRKRLTAPNHSDSLARGAGPSAIHPSHVAANAVGVWGRQSLPQPSARFGHRFLIAPGIYTKVRGS